MARVPASDVVVLDGPIRGLSSEHVNTSTRAGERPALNAAPPHEAPPPRADALIPDDPTDGEYPLEQVAIFDSYGITHRSNGAGDLLLSILVPRTQKWSALPATDHPGKVLQVRVYVDPAHELDDPYDPDLDDDY
jgi:hypothetical protein